MQVVQLVNIDVGECWALLDTMRIGRLAVAVRGHPFIFPVNYTVDRAMSDPTVLMRTAEGLKLDGLLGGPTAALECDDIDQTTGEGWSVVVAGAANIVPGEVGEADAGASAIDLWRTRGSQPVVVRLTPESVTGRRIR